MILTRLRRSLPSGRKRIESLDYVVALTSQAKAAWSSDKVS